MIEAAANSTWHIASLVAAIAVFNVSLLVSVLSLGAAFDVLRGDSVFTAFERKFRKTIQQSEPSGASQ